MIHYDSKIDFRLSKVTSGIFRVYMCQRPSTFMIKALPLRICVCSINLLAVLQLSSCQFWTHTHTLLIPLKMTQMGWKLFHSNLITDKTKFLISLYRVVMCCVGNSILWAESLFVKLCAGQFMNKRNNQTWDCGIYFEFYQSWGPSAGVEATKGFKKRKTRIVTSRNALGKQMVLKMSHDQPIIKKDYRLWINITNEGEPPWIIGSTVKVHS